MPPRSGKKTWVPLFVATSNTDPNSPLITSTILPPTPRRSPPGSAGSLPSPTTSDEGLVYGYPPHYPPPLSPLRTSYANADGVSSSIDPRRASPNLPQHSVMQRSPSNQGQGFERSHVRQRSSFSIDMSSLPGLGVAIPMSRAPSLAGSFSLENLRRNPPHGMYKNKLFEDKRRVSRLVFRTLVLFLTTFIFLTLGMRIVRAISTGGGEEDVVGQPWLHRVLPHSIKGALSSSFETVAYPTSTHPRTPPPADSILFRDYLATRLGSHFSIPTAKTPGHLWLTPASNESVRITTLHLQTFVASLDQQAELINASPSHRRPAKGLVHGYAPRRKLVTLCLDEGCMEFCRSKEDWYCFGGFTITNLRGDRMRKAREMVKMMAAIETLTSGRRVFVVDGDVYFRDDPLPYMGDLDDYDLQIPDSWSSSHTKAGFVALNPTANVIKLWRRLLEIARVDDDVESTSWTTTNILLDPTGENRNLKTPDAEQHLYSEDDALTSGYGQAEFESPWGGGTDVKVLDRKRFRTSTGRLDKRVFEKARQSQAIYFQCACCEDQVTTDYIAGALGYHQPSLAFPTPVASDIPHFPMMLTTSNLNGTAEDVAFSIGLLLQVALDTHRSFVPPLEGRVVENEAVRERYIWRLFPAALWASENRPVPELEVLEPLYLKHAQEHLRSPMHSSKPAAQASATDLSDSLYIDPTGFATYKEFLGAIQRPPFATTRVVRLESAHDVRGREGWELRNDFESLDLCWEDPRGVSDPELSCKTVCGKKPSE